MAAPSYQPRPRIGHCEFLDVDENALDTSNLHARLVDSSTKQRLLANGRSWMQHHVESDIDADTLLSDLGRLAPSVAKDFAPKSSAEAGFAFRLINDIDFEGEEHSYIAMSYVWNKVNRDPPRKMVSPVGDLPFGWVRTVEHFPLPTSRGMFLGMLTERMEREGVWFDQVCINQEDATEKAIAIGAMDTIYRNARTVVVALDDITATGDELFFLQQYAQQCTFLDLQPLQHPNRGLNPPFMQQHPLFRSFLERVLSSIWFERAWCAHEMRMGQSHVFFVACVAEYEDEDISTLIRFTGAFLLHMLVLAGEDPTFAPAQRVLIRSLLEYFGRKAYKDERDALAVRSPQMKYSSIQEPVSLIPTIAEVFRMKAGGNPRLPEHLKRLDANRDKISISLNISRLPLALRPASPLQRPTIEDECLRQLLLIGLAARDPVALCTTGRPLQLHDGSISWLCRPTSLDLPSTSQVLPQRFSEPENPITQGSDGRAEYVQLDLVFLELPHRTQPNPNFTSHVHRAREFINICIQHQIQSHMLWNMWQYPDHPRAPAMTNIFIQTLACALECGPEWFIDVASNFPSTTNSPTLDLHTLGMLFNPQLLLNNYILHPTAPHAFSALLTTLSSLIAYGIPWASDATERTHGPLIISTQPSSPSLHPQPYSPQTYSSGGKAIIFAPFEHSKTLLVAVPDAVKDEAYKGLARGWILTSSNPYTGSPRTMISWELRGKSPIFGDRGFVAGLGMGSSPRNHRVYGPRLN